MSDPAENVPADRPMRWSDACFDFGALGFAVSRTAGVGTVVELADQFHRAFERMKVAIPVIADIHSTSASWTVTIEDVELPSRNRYQRAIGKASCRPPCPGEILESKNQHKSLRRRLGNF